MSWSGIRADLKTTLEAISITSPSAKTIKKVYETPPATIQDVPCFIIYPPRAEVTWGEGAARRMYTVRCRLLLSDADLAVAADLVDAFREATVDKIGTTNLKIGTAAPFGVVVRLVIEEAGAIDLGGKKYAGLDCLLTLNIVGAASLAA